MAPTLHKFKYSDFGNTADLRRQLENEGYSVFSWSDSAGAVYEDHQHSHDEYIVVATGRIVFIINKQRFQLEPGDAFDLPAHTVHAAVNEERTPVSYFICTRG
jgi:quercetin dioxygenase-like cupin family protein